MAIGFNLSVGRSGISRNEGEGRIGATMLFGKRNQKRDQFERYAEAHFGAIFGLSLRLTGNRDEAEDLTQEAVVRAFEAFDRFDGTNFKAWILRITTNLYINKYRSRQRGPGFASLEDENVLEPMSSESAIPDRQLFDGLMGAEVEAALKKIPEEFRIAVLLSDVEQLPYQDIADMTQVPIGTVRSRIARGRAMLRKQLEVFARKEGFIKEGEVF